VKLTVSYLDKETGFGCSLEVSAICRMLLSKFIYRLSGTLKGSVPLRRNSFAEKEVHESGEICPTFKSAVHVINLKKNDRM